MQSTENIQRSQVETGKLNLYPDIRKEQQQKPKREHHGTYLEGPLITSKAWLSMRSPSSFIVYCIISSQVIKLRAKHKAKNKKQQYTCPNERDLKLTYGQAQEIYGISQTKFTRAIDELIEHGFLDVVTPGNASTKTPTIYGISGRWKLYGTERFRAEPRERIKRGFCRTRKQKPKLVN